MKRAIVYHAHCKKRFLRMGAQSAESAKKHMPDVDTVLLTSLPFRNRWFDKIIQVPAPDLVDARMIPFLHLPTSYDSGIYLDCDSYVCTPLYEAFELVEDDRVDIALVHTAGKKRDTHYPSPGIPTAYPHWRGAFMAFQHHDQMRRFFADWEKGFHEHRKAYREASLWEGPCHPRQMSMRIALYRSGLTIVTLRPNYCCTGGGVVVRGYVHMITGDEKEDMARKAHRANRDAPYARYFEGGRARRI